MIWRVALFAILLVLSVPSNGQDNHTKDGQKQEGSEAQPKNNEKQKYAEALKTFRETYSGDAEDELKRYGVDAFPCEKEITDEQTHKSCVLARQAYYAYYSNGLNRRTRVYEWNNFSTRAIFFVVLALVAVGIYFSWKQFFGMVVKPASDGDQSPSKDQPLPMTEFEAGLGGIKVKSPILGVILLTVSLAFFYLYLKFVYPVTTSF